MSKAKQNPFPTSRYGGPETFCDRRKEVDRLLDLTSRSHHATVVSVRRMGKTALIEHLFGQLAGRRGYLTARVDIYPSTSLQSMTDRIATSIASELYQGSRKMVKIMHDILGSTKATLSYDPITGMPNVALSFSSSHTPARALQVLFQQLDNIGKKVVVAIDEFQQVAQFPESNSEAVLRTMMQQCKNTAFVFSGSRKDLMVQMFSDAKRPFYHSTELVHLQEIDRDEYCEFIRHQFSLSHRSISTEVAMTVYNLCRGHTYYVQSLCQYLWRTYTSPLKDDSVVLEALQEITTSMQLEYLSLRTLLAPVQWQLLVAIGREGMVASPTSGKFLSAHGLGSSASVLRALKALIERELVYVNDGGNVVIYNPFFGWWTQHILIE